MNWKHEIGTQIREARKAAGMTQDELATRLDVARQMICRYEAGRDAPSVDVLARAADTLSIVFQVRGLRISFEKTGAHHKPRPLPKQLRFEFEKSHLFRGAVVEITPRKGQILIRAVIPA
jgi:transcriptional regulator with XRE-family HTH domain